MSLSFLPLQALFGEEEAAPRSRAPDVNEFGMISMPNDIVTIHIRYTTSVCRSCANNSFPRRLASLCSTVGERGIPTRTSAAVATIIVKKCEKYQNAKSLPHGDPPKVCMASEQPSQTKMSKIFTSFIYFLFLFYT